MYPSDPSDPFNLVRVCFGFVVRDVFENGCREQLSFLKYVRDLLTKARHCEILDVIPIDQYFTFGGNVVAGYQVGEARFTGARGSDESNDLANFSLQRAVVARSSAVRINEACPAYFDTPFDGW